MSVFSCVSLCVSLTINSVLQTLSLAGSELYWLIGQMEQIYKLVYLLGRRAVNPHQLGTLVRLSFYHEKCPIKCGDCQDIIKENVETKTTTIHQFIKF